MSRFVLGEPHNMATAREKTWINQLELKKPPRIKPKHGIEMSFFLPGDPLCVRNSFPLVGFDMDFVSFSNDFHRFPIFSIKSSIIMALNSRQKICFLPASIERFPLALPVCGATTPGWTWRERGLCPFSGADGGTTREFPCGSHISIYISPIESRGNPSWTWELSFFKGTVRYIVAVLSSDLWERFASHFSMGQRKLRAILARWRPSYLVHSWPPYASPSVPPWRPWKRSRRGTGSRSQVESDSW